MAGLVDFGTIAVTLFVTELTDKDAFLLLAVSTKIRWRVAFLAGALAFTLNSILFVAAGTLLIAYVPVYWVRFAGGVAMLAYGLWQARGLMGERVIEEEESRLGRGRGPWRAFLALVAALSLLDIAGDATEILTIVFVAHYADALLVLTGVIAGLVTATAVETALGNRLGRFLTPNRLRYVSVIVFLALGGSILLLNS